MSTGSAKNARKASDMPSNSNSGRWSVSSANEFALQDLLGHVAHTCSRAHGRLLNHFEGFCLVHAALSHEEFLGTLNNLARLDLVIGARCVVRHQRLAGRRIEDRRELGQDLATSK